MSRLEGRVAIVTGGGRGLGRAMALALAAEGAHVTVAGRTRADLDGVVREIEKLGGHGHAAAVDVRDEASVRELVDGAHRRAGRLDVLVNNAGVIVRKPTLASTVEEWRDVMEINVTGTYLCSVAAARHMVPARSGKIINLSSVAGVRGRAAMAAYCASKAAVINLTRALAVEWAPHGVYVNAIAPGQFDTEMGAPVLADPASKAQILARVPLARIGQPQDIGPLAVFLASADSDMITGEVIFIDGGANAA